MPLIEAARAGRIDLLAAIFGGRKEGQGEGRRARRATAKDPAFRAFSSGAEIIAFAERHNARLKPAAKPRS